MNDKFKYQYCKHCDFGFYVEIDESETKCCICDDVCKDNNGEIEYTEYIYVKE